MNETASCKKCKTETVHVKSFDEDRNPVSARVCLKCKATVVALTLLRGGKLNIKESA